MKWFILFILLLSCLTISAQPLTLNDPSMWWKTTQAAAAAPSFDPSTVPGLYIDLDASVYDALPTGTQVPGTNKVSGGAVIVQTTAASRPFVTNNASIFNNAKFLAFDASNDYIDAIYSTPSVNTTIFIVSGMSVDQSWSPLFSSTNTTDYQTLLFTPSPNSDLSMRGGNILNCNGTPQGPIKIFEAVFNGATSFLLTNGVVGIASSDVGAKTMDGLRIGASQSLSTYSPLMTPRVLIFTNTVVSSDNRTYIRTNLNNLYHVY